MIENQELPNLQQTSQELVLLEVENLINKTKESFKEVKRFAIDKAWNLLQLATASIVQIIEIIGKDLSSPEKKELAIKSIEIFYDNVLLYVDLPFVPTIIEKYLHNYVKKFLMLLVGSTIDSMVKIFRDTGVFRNKLHYI
jgi:hypothetical protein